MEEKKLARHRVWHTKKKSFSQKQKKTHTQKQLENEATRCMKLCQTTESDSQIDLSWLCTKKNSIVTLNWISGVQ